MSWRWGDPGWRRRTASRPATGRTSPPWRARRRLWRARSWWPERRRPAPLRKPETRRAARHSGRPDPQRRGGIDYIPSAALVALSTWPVAVRPWAWWKLLRAALVFGPILPSTVRLAPCLLRASWRLFTEALPALWCIL